MTRILLVDDCEDLRDAVHELLHDLGMECVSTSDLSSALTELEAAPIDLVLCDLVLPVEEDPTDENASAMVGVHAIHTISRKYPLIPVVAISGALTGAPLNNMTQFGATSSLSKPFGQEELRATIEFALRGKQTHA